MRIEPLNDRIVVVLQESEKTTASGIVIPESSKTSSNLAEVVAAGPGRVTDTGELIATRVAVGDEVLLTQGAGQTASVDGEDITIIREDEILAIVNKGDE